MKKIFNLPLFLILFITSFSFMSCSDDEGEITTNNIVGTWKSTHWLMDEDINDGSFFGTGEQYVQFNADGSCIEVDIYDDYDIGFGEPIEGSIDIIRGSWFLSDDKLRIEGDGLTPATFDVLKLTDDELTISYMGITMPYVRVSDSEINQYLNE